MLLQVRARQWGRKEQQKNQTKIKDPSAGL